MKQSDFHAATYFLRLRWRALLRNVGRRQVRDNEVALSVVSAIIGATVGIGVVAVREFVQLLHQLNFGLPSGRLLSEGIGLTQWRIALIPCVGGLLVGLVALAIRRLRPHEIVDAIEANALYGGKMSLIDSLNLMLLTLMSSGFGASVGLEAAYTQLGAGAASRFGTILRVRRNDLRTLVGCGAAAAIAAAFNAPLAGAFYAFELIIGSYSTQVLAPVIIAALTGTFAARLTVGSEPLFFVSTPTTIHGWDYAIFAAMGVGAAFLGIVTMLGVTWIEKLLRGGRVPAWARSACGGLVVGGIALVCPQVLGSGHGAIQEVIGGQIPVLPLLLLIPAKALASAISVGSGFRGGLFSSSLFLGALFGSVVAGTAQHIFPGIEADRLAYILVGMGSVAAAIVGAPITMILLILELTADFYASVGVMIGVVVAIMIVRLGFGYSFATWRFHQRGIPLRGATDIGWIRDLTVGRLMRRDAQLISENLPLAEFRRHFPLGATKQVFLTDGDGNYAGVINTVDAHNPDLDDRIEAMTAGSLRHGEGEYLLRFENVRTALDHFVAAELEALPVLAGPVDRKVIGLLTEAYALRRYNQELEKARGDLGDSSLFAPSMPPPSS